MASGWVEDRHCTAGRRCIAPGLLRPQVLDDIEIDGGNPTVFGKAGLDPALEADSGRTYVILSLPGVIRSMTGRPSFLEK